MAVFSNAEHMPFYDPAILCSVIYPQKHKVVHQKTCTIMFTPELFVITTKLEATQISMKIEQFVVCPYEKILYRNENLLPEAKT